ncbi:MAG: hypothetical protein KAT50_10280, partial [Pirellulales bacterium]|nr:hypothetical protein [Pirellulales bacterium]
IPDPAIRSNTKTTVINDHSITSGLSCARTRPLFAFWISCKLRTGNSLGVASWLWRIFTLVYHHSGEALLGETQTIAKPSVDTHSPQVQQATNKALDRKQEIDSKDSEIKSE